MSGSSAPVRGAVLDIILLRCDGESSAPNVSRACAGAQSAHHTCLMVIRTGLRVRLASGFGDRFAFTPRCFGTNGKVGAPSVSGLWSRSCRNQRPPQPPTARRMAEPWRGGQRALSKVRLTVSPENLPVTFEEGTRLDPTILSGVVPEKLPSGASAKFCIATVARACDTTPDNWPPALVRRTSHSPQKRDPGTRVPCTVQVPSAIWLAVAGATVCTRATGGAAGGAAGASTGDWHALCVTTHPAISRKRNNLQNTVRRVRSMIQPP